MYAKFTDTGINPVEAAKRLNMDWDSAAEIEDAEIDDVEVPPAVVGFLFLYILKLQLFVVKLNTTYKFLMCVFIHYVLYISNMYLTAFL